MKNVLYEETLMPAANSVDGESPVKLFVTEEVNGHAVFISGHETGIEILRWFGCESKSNVIKWAVTQAIKDERVLEILVVENARHLPVPALSLPAS